MKSMLNLLTNRYLQGEMSGLFYFELRVNCPQTMSIHDVSFRVTKDLKFSRHRASNQSELLTMTNAFNGFLMVLGSFNHWFQWFSMVMDHWSNNAMVLMDHSPLNFHKIENFK